MTRDTESDGDPDGDIQRPALMGPFEEFKTHNPYGKSKAEVA